MKAVDYTVVCHQCGFVYSVMTDRERKSDKREFEKCPCGAKAELIINNIEIPGKPICKESE